MLSTVNNLGVGRLSSVVFEPVLFYRDANLNNPTIEMRVLVDAFIRRRSLTSGPGSSVPAMKMAVVGR